MPDESDGVPDNAQAELLRKIVQEKALSPALTADLKAAADQFKETWR